MNYKTLIAFLGKNQMKDWSTPKSDWILVCDYGDKEFQHSIPESIPRVQWVSDMETKLATHQNSWAFRAPADVNGGKLYYNEEYQMGLVFKEFFKGKQNEIDKILAHHLELAKRNIDDGARYRPNEL
jgi:hypothetical protein